MNASSILLIARFGFLGLAVGVPACNRDEGSGSGEPRAAVDATQRDAPTRQGVEPAPDRGEDNAHRAGQQLPEDRDRFVADSRARIEEIDRELALMRDEAQQRGEPMSAELEEERRVIDRQFDELQRAPEDDWKQARDRLAKRIDELAFALDQLREPGPAARTR